MVLKRTILAPKYIINNVKYAEESVAQYDEPYLYKAISQEVKWNNYNILRIFKKNKILRAIQKHYPILADIHFDYSWPNEMTVLVTFHDPQLIIRHKKRRFAIYNGYHFELFSGSSLWSSGVQELRLPMYLTDFKNLDGIFFDTQADILLEQTYKIQENFPNLEKIVYLPGSQRTIVLMPKWVKIYINNIRPLEEQFANYKKLAKYYDGFDKLYQIDLWSLEKDRIIVK